MVKVAAFDSPKPAQMKRFELGLVRSSFLKAMGARHI